MNKKLSIIIAATAIACIIGYLFGKSSYQSQYLFFKNQNDSLSAVLNIPEKTENNAVPLLIFVHGDGAMPADGHGYFKPIWEALAKKGIASMSWDKKGIGKSSGNWLEQSMEDRAEEVISAIRFIESKKEFNFSSIGLIGFSQGGWVLPKVSTLSDYPDFMIVVSGAINWKRQSNFLTRKRLEHAGTEEFHIKEAIVQNEADFQIFNEENTYSDYLDFEKRKCEKGLKSKCNPMSAGRFQFIQKNITADASLDIQNIKCPLLGLWGSDDLNVDHVESYETYQSILSKSNPKKFRLKTFPNATHSILKSEYFNTPNPGLGWMIKFKLFGKNAYADNFFKEICEFVLNHN